MVQQHPKVRRKKLYHSTVGVRRCRERGAPLRALTPCHYTVRVKRCCERGAPLRATHQASTPHRSRQARTPNIRAIRPCWSDTTRQDRRPSSSSPRRTAVLTFWIRLARPDGSDIRCACLSTLMWCRSLVGGA
eukprot:9492533-Pyramimonas_sp.AAC.1